MRPRFIITLGLLTLLILGAALLLKRQLGSVSAPPAKAEIATPDSAAGTSMAPPPAPIPIAAAAATNVLTEEQRLAAIDAERDRLQEWSMNNDDPASLSYILADLTSPEKEIREAAIEAAKQFGSSNAIPVLKAAAANAEDNQEAIAMLEAADWLALPSVDFSHRGTKQQLTPEQIQAQEQARAKAQARWNENLQRHASSQNSQSSPGQNTTTGQNQ